MKGGLVVVAVARDVYWSCSRTGFVIGVRFGVGESIVLALAGFLFGLLFAEATLILLFGDCCPWPQGYAFVDCGRPQR